MEAAKYRLRGERRSVKGFYVDRFETVVVATGYDDAQAIARFNWRNDWHDIKFSYVARIV